MSDGMASQRSADFKTNYLVWIVLRHFLPANLIEELSSAIVDAATEGKVTLSSLFDKRIFGKPSETAIWIVRPLPTSKPFERYLQDLIRGFVWQNDQSWGWAATGLDDAESTKMRALEMAVKISTLDLAAVVELPVESVPEPLLFLTNMMARTGAPIITGSFDQVTDDDELALPIPLNGLVLKHLGDLCGDADRWDIALKFYNRASSIFSGDAPAAWQDLLGSLKAINAQSIAAATWFAIGPKSASALFNQDGNLDDTLLQSINASTDATVCARDADDSLAGHYDTRIAILWPPQILETNHLTHALQSWLEGKLDDSLRWFWAVLRRQISLGSATYARTTKAYFGRAIIDGLANDESLDDAPNNFRLGVKLVIESGLPKVVAKIRWPERLVARHVDAELIDATVVYANNMTGVKLERTLVTLILFGKWLRVLAPDATQIAEPMLRLIAVSAKDCSWSFIGNRNISGAAFEVLKEVGHERPEFRIAVAGVVIDAVIEKLGDDQFQAVATAIETAVCYVDALNTQELRTLIKAVLRCLNRYKGGSGPWPVTHPALTLLSSREVEILSSQDVALKSEVSAALLRVSFATETENTRILYLLQDINPALMRDEVDMQQLKSIISRLRTKVMVNSSAAEGDIMALLIAPMITGIDGVRDGIEGFRLILESAALGKPRIAFPRGYRPLMLLADRKLDLADKLSLTETQLAAMIEPLFAPLLRMWHTAFDNPTIFAGFSIPPRSAPNPTNVHNWTFASISFAQSFGLETEINAAIATAAQNPSLANSIAVARAIRITAGDAETFDIDAINNENRDAFYAALGQRLVLLSSLPLDTRRKVTAALLERCFQLGPSGLDAGIFAAALDAGLADPLTSHFADAYRRRVDNNRDLRLCLIPMLQGIERLCKT